MVRRGWLALGALVACGSAPGTPGGSRAGSGPEARSAESPVESPLDAERAAHTYVTRAKRDPAPGSPEDAERLSLDEARAYVVTLVNRDRKAAGLAPVKLDAVSTKAGDLHARDMAANGFTAHFGTDGSVPELRYTRAGGVHMVTENAGCLADGKPRELDPEPRFSREALERVEHAFMDEVPPYDGHRKNILNPRHRSVGIGLAKPKGLDVACMAQEFVDEYATLEPLPANARVGERVTVAGKERKGAVVMAVGVSRFDLVAPRAPADLLKLLSYAIPRTYVTYFPKGYKTTVELERKGETFSIRVPLDDRKKPGVYGVSVWAMFPPSQELEMISLRTIEVSGSK